MNIRNRSEVRQGRLFKGGINSGGNGLGKGFHLNGVWINTRARSDRDGAWELLSELRDEHTLDSHLRTVLNKFMALVSAIAISRLYVQQSFFFERDLA